MRKFIIDTDTGSDDAAALLLAAASEEIEILGVTTVSGNVPLKQATLNALMTLETAECGAKVYPGASKPLLREPVHAANVHGLDGMGDRDLVHPSKMAEDQNAVSFLIETVKKYPGEVEIVALGPATNLAAAIVSDRETLSKVKHIWSMGTPGFGPGNVTPVAEFNVFADAESYDILLRSGIPLTLIGFDLCLGDAIFTEKDMETLYQKTKMSQFVYDCTAAVRGYNLEKRGEAVVDIPDAVAMAVALWEDLVKDSLTTCCRCCYKEDASYGQVVIYDPALALSGEGNDGAPNATVVRTIDGAKFKKRFLEALLKK